MTRDCFFLRFFEVRILQVLVWPQTSEEFVMTLLQLIDLFSHHVTLQSRKSAKKDAIAPLWKVHFFSICQ
jgi:hypothetical protein